MSCYVTLFLSTRHSYVIMSFSMLATVMLWNMYLCFIVHAARFGQNKRSKGEYNLYYMGNNHVCM
jgi:hypothetical protein